MENKIQIFKNEQFGQIRTVKNEAGEPLFCFLDICKCLGYVNTRAALRRHIEQDDVTKRDVIDGMGRMQPTTFINESGLYSLILSSKLPQAREFKHWVTSEVLPQIRRTGGYIPAHKEDAQTVMARALLIAQRTIEDKNRLLAEQRPLAELGEAVSGSKDSILIRDLAKLLTQNGVPMGQNRLFAWLRQHGYLFQHETRPIQLWVERGIFDLSVNVIATHHGTQERITTRVTGKGQRYFLERMLREINGSDKEVTRTVQVQRD